MAKIDVRNAPKAPSAVYLDFASDCLMRARDGVQSGNWQYVMTQVTKAQHYLKEAGFHADLKDLLEKNPKQDLPPPKKAEPLPST